MMELQLGLALPTSTFNKDIPITGFDLNYFGYEPTKGDQYHQKYPSFVSCNNYNKKKKRKCGQAFSEEDDRDQDIVTVPKTLPLLLWNNRKPNDEDDDPSKDLYKNTTHNFIKNDGEGDGVVGWPPIKAWRRRLICFHGGGRAVENGCSCGGRISKFMHVKVKMEGVAIARKIDLNLHTSFNTLTHTLMDMFGKCPEDSVNYKLTYQDREGDWLLAQDVPWRTFIRSVQRLKLLRRSH
ncbi:auxin-responsive protein IAA29-like [Humulus lupulus]|uniref:auxin-responsive protein IAA29-like n=1 Tax=Humulus lupulus TaxID=3486 RepID=UPI002B41433A|nr:auxin-responsive protein IAA29-like [Humulus lupulus]